MALAESAANIWLSARRNRLGVVGERHERRGSRRPALERLRRRRGHGEAFTSWRSWRRRRIGGHCLEHRRIARERREQPRGWPSPPSRPAGWPWPRRRWNAPPAPLATRKATGRLVAWASRPEADICARIATALAMAAQRLGVARGAAKGANWPCRPGDRAGGRRRAEHRVAVQQVERRRHDGQPMAANMQIGADRRHRFCVRREQQAAGAGRHDLNDAGLAAAVAKAFGSLANTANCWALAATACSACG